MIYLTLNKGLGGFQIKLTKKQKELCSQILSVIYPDAPISRIDISNKTGITPATVSHLTGIMIESNLLYELGETQYTKTTVGRKKILLNISPEYSFFIGCEISEAFYSFVITDNLGNIVSKSLSPITSSKEVQTSDIFIKDLLSFYKSAKVPISAIGIALPGHYNRTNKIFTNNMVWRNFDLNKIIDMFDIPIFFDNNVNCMALAEHLFYSDKNENFIFFHISRGIHCSYFYNGDIFSKENFLIGEVGHMVVNTEGPICECGKKGCLQTYASEAWILKNAKLLYQKSSSTFLHQLVKSDEEISIDTVLTAYNLGDPIILKLLNDAIKFIALTINNLNMILDSSKLFIHGKLFDNHSLTSYLNQLISIEPKLLTTFSKNEELTLKSYSCYSGSVGAAALCIHQRILNQSFVI